jgi:hypothetical protein
MFFVFFVCFLCFGSVAFHRRENENEKEKETKQMNGLKH